MKSRRLAFAAAAAVVAVGAAAVMRPRPSVEAEFDGEPDLVAATFASAWCSSCKILEPTLAAVIPDFADAPIAFVRFDFTFGESAEAQRLAARYRIAAAYERNKGATGFTLLIDPDRGEIVDTLTMSFSEDAMRAAIAGALDEVSSSTDGLPQTGAPARSGAL